MACPPGMFRQLGDRLCQLCPKGSYAPEFSSRNCIKCPRHHTTRGLGSRREEICFLDKKNLRTIVCPSFFPTRRPDQCHYRRPSASTAGIFGRGRGGSVGPDRTLSSSGIHGGGGGSKESSSSKSVVRGSRTGKKSRLGFMFYSRCSIQYSTYYSLIYHVFKKPQCRRGFTGGCPPRERAAAGDTDKRTIITREGKKNPKTRRLIERNTGRRGGGDTEKIN